MGGAGSHVRYWQTQKINLSQYLINQGGSQNAIDGLVKEQYEDIRLPLFHARDAAYVMPGSGPSVDRISKAYERLVLLTREVAKEFHGLSSSSGAVYPSFFRSQVRRMLERGCRIAVSSDDSEENSDEASFSPKGCDVAYLNSLRIDDTSELYAVIAEAHRDLRSEPIGGQIVRVGLLSAEEPLIVGRVLNELRCDGADEPVVRIRIGFENAGMPRMQFPA